MSVSGCISISEHVDADGPPALDSHVLMSRGRRRGSTSPRQAALSQIGAGCGWALNGSNARTEFENAPVDRGEFSPLNTRAWSECDRPV